MHIALNFTKEAPWLTSFWCAEVYCARLCYAFPVNWIKLWVVITVSGKTCEGDRVGGRGYAGRECLACCRVLYGMNGELAPARMHPLSLE